MKEMKMKEIKNHANCDWQAFQASLENVHVLDVEYGEVEELVRQVRDRNCYGYDLQERVFNLGAPKGR